MKKAIALSSSIGALLAMPSIVWAATFGAATSVGNLSDVGNFIVNTINGVVVPVLFAVAFIVFLWGAFKTFILGSQSSDVAKEGKNLMLWGLIGFFVMVSIWGLVNILSGTVSFGNNRGPSGGTPQANVQIGN